MNRALLWRLTIPWLATACAVSEPANRRTLNELDARFAPESMAARVATLPVTFPVAVLGLAADAVIVHPACVTDDAWGDTVEWLWETGSESRFRTAVMLPLRVLATPFVFTGDWLTRSMIAVPPRKEAP